MTIAEACRLSMLVADDSGTLIDKLDRTLSTLAAVDVTTARTLPETQVALDAMDFDLVLLATSLQGRFTGPIAERLSAEHCPFVFMVDGASRQYDLRPYPSLSQLTRPISREALREVLRGHGFLPRPPLVLILEDDTDLWFQWIDEFSKRGIDCTTANSIHGALRTIRHSRIDAVVTDMVMSDIDGHPSSEGGERLILNLRDPSLADLPRWTFDVPVVALTGSDPKSQALPLASRLGANAVFRKPVPPAVLADAVEELLDGPPSG